MNSKRATGHTTTTQNVHLFTNPMTWPEIQTRLILGIRNAHDPPSADAGTEFRDIDPDDEFHAKWSDPGLFAALQRMQYHIGDLVQQYGGRDPAGVTWIKFYEGDRSKIDGLGGLIFVLWLHESDDPAVEGTFDDLDWESGSVESSTEEHEGEEAEAPDKDVDNQEKEEEEPKGTNIA